MKNQIATPNTRLVDIISSTPYILMILPRFKMNINFGDKTISEICTINNVDTEFFLMVCNIYAFRGFVPSKEMISNSDMSHLVPYLKASHNYYLEKRLPHIETHLNRINEFLPTKTARVIMQFFSGYKNEVASHFEMEEKNIFPYLNALISNNKTVCKKNINISSIHASIEDKLDDLTQILFKFLPTSAPSDEVANVVYDILHLSEDLKKHALIEEMIMIKYINANK